MNVCSISETLIKIQPDPGKKLIYLKDGKEHSEAIVEAEELDLFDEVHA